MTAAPVGLTSALADRYRIERELGQGGMARQRVAKATATAADTGVHLDA